MARLSFLRDKEIRRGFAKATALTLLFLATSLHSALAQETTVNTAVSPGTSTVEPASPTAAPSAPYAPGWGASFAISAKMSVAGRAAASYARGSEGILEPWAIFAGIALDDASLRCAAAEIRNGPVMVAPRLESAAAVEIGNGRLSCRATRD